MVIAHKLKYFMLYKTILNRKINHLHERSLKIVYRDRTSFVHELLQKDHSLTILGND